MTTQRSTISLSLAVYFLCLCVIHVMADDSVRWAWMGGSTSTNALGVFGEQNTPSTTNIPGARYYPVGWYDSSTQELWLFGGLGYGESDFGAFFWHSIPIPSPYF